MTNTITNVKSDIISSYLIACTFLLYESYSVDNIFR